MKAYEVAGSFYDYSKEIQLFVTTHSPAFYQIGEDEHLKVFYVRKKQLEGTIASDSRNEMEIGESMGLMPLVAPYISSFEKEYRRLHNMIDAELSTDIPTVFVEGRTDKEYLELAIDLYSPELKEKIEKHQLRIFTKKEEGGCTQVKNWVLAWIYSHNKSKTLALFDKDKAGIEAYNELKEDDVFKSSQNNKVSFLEPTDEIKQIYKANLYFEYEIEHLLSLKCWDKIKSMGYAVERDAFTIQRMIKTQYSIHESAEEILKRMIPDVALRETIVCYEPHEDAKDKILNMVKYSTEEEKKEFMKGFEKTVRSMEKRFISPKDK